jgi:hypothetical protein
MTYIELEQGIKLVTDQNLTILKVLEDKVSPEVILTIINKPLTTNNLYIRELLAESNGYLIYNHQLEKFIMDKLGFTPEAAKELRRDWNKKSIRKREPLIQSDSYFLIENKMPQYFVFDKIEVELN